MVVNTDMRRTVAVVDMVGYSDVAKMLEENTSVGSVASLNHQIQEFISRALGCLEDQDSYCLMTRVGDGAIVLFERSEDAHCFAVAVHKCAKEHNDQRSERTAKRWFRIGMALGEVHRDCRPESSDEYAGITIANAVRLESSAAAGQIVIDLATYAELYSTSCACYGAEETTRGKRKEIFRVRRYQVVRPLSISTTYRLRPLTRRDVIWAVVGMAAAATAGTWWKWSEIERWTHPLPAKRFVTLIAWPPSTLEQTPRLASLLETIHARLSRTETYIRDLLILGSEEMNEDATQSSQDRNYVKSPREVAEAWGANLILAASLTLSRSETVLHLQLLEAEALHLVRESTRRFSIENLGSINQISADLSAQMLDLPFTERAVSDEQELAGIVGPARDIDLQGKLLSENPNDEKIIEAAEKFRQSIVISPEFALAHAQLGLLYLRRYSTLRDTDLYLAKTNLALALKINPNSETAQMGRVRLLLITGKPDDALVGLTHILKGDPGNTEALFRKSEVFQQTGKPKEQEQIYRELIRLRPNYWKAYNDLGKFLFNRVRYDEAEQCFKTATIVAPRETLPLINLGQIYIAKGRPEDARSMFGRSLELTPSESAYESLGDLSYGEKDYRKAKEYYSNALKTLPTSHFLWSDLGDVYDMLSDANGVVTCYRKAAELLSSELSINPNNGTDWVILALYEAKAGSKEEATAALREGDRRKATDTHAMFIKARVLMSLGKEDDAEFLVLQCIDQGLEPGEVDLAPELGKIRNHASYIKHLQIRREAKIKS